MAQQTSDERLHTLDQEIESLRENYAILIKSFRIGKFKETHAMRNTQMRSDMDDKQQTKEVPVDLTRQKFQEIFDGTMRQEFIQQTAAHQIVQSAHNLIDLIHELKISYVINDNQIKIDQHRGKRKGQK